MKIIYLISALISFLGVDVVLAAPTPNLSPRIVLLTSIQRPRLERKLERVFSRKMKTLAKKGWKIEIKHRADAYDLHEALSDELTEGVIWVSHGSFRMIGATHEVGGSISAKPMLMDYQGDDVASVLTLRHSQLKFLSVVGCNSKQILDYQNDVNTSHEDLNELETYIPDHKVVAQWALRRASKRAERTFESRKFELSSVVTPEATGNGLEIERHIPSEASAGDLRPIRVYLAGRLIGVLPKGRAGEIQKVRLNIPTQLGTLPNAKWKIRVETGQHVETRSEAIIFGELRFKSGRELDWKIFSDAEGKPFGLNFRLYLPN